MPLDVMERYTFHNQNRQENETVTDYVAALRTLATHCNFGSELENNIRDRLVCGVGNAAAQAKLLTVKNLTLEKAVELAKSEEITHGM